MLQAKHHIYNNWVTPTIDNTIDGNRSNWCRFMINVFKNLGQCLKISSRTCKHWQRVGSSLQFSAPLFSCWRVAWNESHLFFSVQWTTDQDLQDAMASIGVSDLISVKFHENRTNGQSKGFVYLLNNLPGWALWTVYVWMFRQTFLSAKYLALLVQKVEKVVYCHVVESNIINRNTGRHICYKYY